VFKHAKEIEENMIEVDNPNYHKLSNFDPKATKNFKLHKPMLDIEHSKRKMGWGNALRFYIMILILVFVCIWIFVILPQNSASCSTQLQAESNIAGVYK
jgi:hypothetical protein